MKKGFLLSFLFLFGLASYILMAPMQAEAETSFATGTVVKGEGLSTLYYIGEDGKRYVFPNDKIYYSWFEDFANVQEISMEELYELPLGGNVRYKPGNLLIKIKTDPKVYAVGNNGKLHWIKTEKLAKALYGDDWNLLIDDVADSFFTNYDVDEPIDEDDDFDPEEEEDETPSISHNLGFKARLKIAIEENKEQRRCNRLEDILKRTQKRLARFGIEADDLGEDYISECFDEEDDVDNENGKRWKQKIKNRLKWFTKNKITICHQTDEGERTISVNKNAVPAHLAHGDYIGECGTTDDDDDADDNDDSDDGDGDDDVDDDDDVVDETAPVISDVEFVVTANTATITWTTDEAADSELEYATSTLASASEVMDEDSDNLVTSHSIVLENLEASTTYYFVVKSEDEAENEAESDEYTFTTEAEEVVDETAPVISNLVNTVGATSTLITWETDEVASSKISYSIGAMDAAIEIMEIESDELVSTHSVELLDLATSTEYFFKIEVEDEAENELELDEDSFTTLAE